MAHVYGLPFAAVYIFTQTHAYMKDIDIRTWEQGLLLKDARYDSVVLTAANVSPTTNPY